MKTLHSAGVLIFISMMFAASVNAQSVSATANINFTLQEQISVVNISDLELNLFPATSDFPVLEYRVNRNGTVTVLNNSPIDRIEVVSIPVFTVTGAAGRAIDILSNLSAGSTITFDGGNIVFSQFLLDGSVTLPGGLGDGDTDLDIAVGFDILYNNSANPGNYSESNAIEITVSYQ
ncbi:MAG: hypothetical protein LAT67_04880 [Balneolales bacterium]|nr:hypothetical protein [Balneolales bacterium]